MNIAIVVNSLMLGGSERMAVWLSEALVDEGHSVTLITILNETTDFYELSPKVRRISLRLGRPASHFFQSVFNVSQRAFTLRHTLQTGSYDVAVSFADKTNILMVMSIIGMKLPCIISERGYLGWMGFTLRRFLARITYPLANKVVSVSDGIDASLAWLPHNKRMVIYNPIRPVPAVDENTNILLDRQQKNMISVGRLTYSKNYPLLLQAFQKIAVSYPDWNLSILGNGELENELRGLIEQFDLQGRVTLCGLVKNVYQYLFAADMFVLSSLHEGTPNALLEAMSCGLPVITTDYEGDPHGIIDDGENGIIVPSNDVDALAAVMAHLMSNEAERLRLGENATNILERFSPENIIAQWENVLKEVSQT